MITKKEIVSATLDQLTEKFRISPESFELSSYSAELEKDHYIVWQSKIKSGDDLIIDPNQEERCVVVCYSPNERTITVRIFKRTFNTFFNIEGVMADATTSYDLPDMTLLHCWNKNVKKFFAIHRLIKEHRDYKETATFLNKLKGVFPSIIDSHLLGK